jgi:hypothetical protein
VPEVSRRLYLRGATGVVASNLSAGTEASTLCSAVKRRAIMTVDASGTAASPAVSPHQLWSRHASAASASSHGPLTARLTRAVGGPSSFGGPRPFAPSRERVRGPGSRGLLSVFWILGYPGPPAPGPCHRPTFSPGENRRPKLFEKTLMSRRLMRRTTVETAKDQKTSSRAPAGEERDHVHVSSACWRAEQEDKGQKTAYCPRYPRQGGDQLSLCLPKAA